MRKSIKRYLPDRPVGAGEDSLWRDDDFRAQLGNIAESVVAPILTGVEADSMTFAIYGGWGMGKSSALKIIQVQNNQDAFHEDDAGFVGNTAITAEAIKDQSLALGLYQAALSLAPNHSNNLQNYLDFLLKLDKPKRPEVLEEAARVLSTLKSAAHASHRPERTRMLERRLQSLKGGAQTRTIASSTTSNQSSKSCVITPLIAVIS